jgi:hypothetical protein
VWPLDQQPLHAMQKLQYQYKQLLCKKNFGSATRFQRPTISCSLEEVIKAAGHLCIFLPKFHCELNFIKFFWGAMKRYLCGNCDYTFATLQENLPKALTLVDLKFGVGNIR